MKIRLFSLIACLPMLAAIQCEEEFEVRLAYQDFKVSVSPFSSFTLTDTLWIDGNVSSQVYEFATQDSIFAETPTADVFGIYQFYQPDDLSNCKDAIDQFELIYANGEFSSLPICENAQLQVLPVLDDNTSFFTYRLGIIPQAVGDYVLSWQSAILLNSSRNEFIIEDYPINNYPDQIGFNRCGQRSWRFLADSDREFYFRVNP